MTTCPDYAALETHLNAPDDAITTHLRDCEACRFMLREMDANNQVFARISGSTLDRPDSLVAAPTIPGYELHEELHRGGQGVVYRATQHATNRTVAVKVLLAGPLATSTQRHRFDREIELLAGLEHPNLITIYDSGRTADGTAWLAMRFLNAPTLEVWRSTGRDRTRRHLLRLFEQICDGVAAAHQRGVMHRDLKPANILIDATSTPHIVDFGLARQVDDVESLARVTQAGSFLGTLAYCAPEQLRQDAVIDTRADVYALGVILYELLSGELPIDVSGDLPDTLRGIADDPPPPLPVDRDLDTITRTALAKDRDRRYESAAALRDDIRRYLDRRPIAARRDNPLYIIAKTLTRHRFTAGVAAVGLILLIGFVLALIAQNHRITREVNKVRQINLFLEDTLASVQPVRPGAPVTVHNMLDEAVMWIDIALADEPDVAASIHTLVGNGYRNLGDFAAAEQQLTAARQLREDALPHDPAAAAQSRNALALLRQAQGDVIEAERLFREALALREQAFSADSYEVSLSRANLSRLLRRTGDLDAAEAELRESLRIRRTLFGESHADVAMCLYSLGELCADRGDRAAAITHHRDALRIRRRVLHPHHPDLPRSLLTLGHLYTRAGDREAGIALLREAVHHREAALPAGHQLIDEARAALDASE